MQIKNRHIEEEKKIEPLKGVVKNEGYGKAAQPDLLFEESETAANTCTNILDLINIEIRDSSRKDSSSINNPTPTEYNPNIIQSNPISIGHNNSLVQNNSSPTGYNPNLGQSNDTPTGENISSIPYNPVPISYNNAPVIYQPTKINYDPKPVEFKLTPVNYNSIPIEYNRTSINYDHGSRANSSRVHISQPSFDDFDDFFTELANRKAA